MGNPMRRLLCLCAVCALLLAGGTAPAGSARPETGAAPRQGTAWVIETVDAPPYTLFTVNRNLVLDSQGRPHVVYGTDFLYYAWRDGAVWHRELVDDTSGVGAGASLALDSQDRPQVSYYDQAGGVKYARFDGQRWQIEWVDSAQEWTTSLALDGAGRPHIAYRSGGSLKYARWDGVSWQIATVDSFGDTGYMADLALDAVGNPHMSYGLRPGPGRYDYDLKYARWDGLAWLTETVTLDTYMGWWNRSDMALDSTGQPRIVYCVYSHSRDDCISLGYARYDGAAWQIETVSDGDAHFLSLVLDAQDQPHISYGSGLRYIYYDGSTWHAESLGSIVHDTSLALDADGRPHIFYEDRDSSALQYTYWDGSAWQTETVDYTGAAGSYTSLALDAAGRPHVSYCLFEWSNCDCVALRYAYYDGRAWQRETVATDLEYYGGNTSLALDTADQPSISYTDDTTSELRYARYDGAAWMIETVDGAGRLPDGAWENRMPLWVTGKRTSLVLDQGDVPHISYYGTNRVLKYAWLDGTEWQTETVDSAADVGLYNSLELDVLGDPHIVYYDTTHGDLKYAYGVGRTWQIETIDSVGDVGRFCSLALDAAGRPHVSYYDATNGDLRYARWDGASWRIETVDSGGGAGEYTSLALDAANHPHISYHSYTGYALRYARYDGGAWQIETIESGLGTEDFDTALALDALGRPHIGYFDGLNGTDRGNTWTTGGDNWGNGDLKYAFLCGLVGDAAIAGPVSLPVAQVGVYTATYTPITATLPAFAWDNGTLGPTAAYSWTVPGVYTITVTATNGCSVVSATLPVEVRPYRRYIPVIDNPYFIPWGSK